VAAPRADVRFSPSAYNDMADIERVLSALE
jgi:selenocysteine lyase/cysteine desulfurase